MSYTYEKLENDKVKVMITISHEDFEKAVEESYQANCGKFSVQGFRKGKAPRKVIEKQYGEGVFFDDAIDSAFSKEYYEFLQKETSIEPIENPEIKIEKFDDKGILISAVAPVLPEIKLGVFKGLTVKQKTIEVTDKEVDDEIESIRNRQARFVEKTDRECKIGDTVTIDFTGYVDGQKFEGGEAKDYRLELGSNSFIPGFEDQVAGMKIGEEKTIKVTFPKDYQAENLAGEETEFVINLHKIEERELPEVNDEFASNVSEFENLADYKADIKAHKEHENMHKAEHQAENDLIEQIVKASSVNIPECLVERQLDAFLKDLEMRLSYQGIKLDDYVKYTNTTVEEIRKARKETAQESVKTRLVLEEIIKEEKLFVTEGELNQKVEEMASKYKKSLEDYKKQLGDRQLAYIENEILMNKLMDYLKSNNTIVKE